MKKNFILLGLLLSFVSCKTIDIDTNEEVLSPLLSQIQGHYEGCAANPTYANAYAKVIVDVSGEDMTYTMSTHSASNCSDTTGPIRYIQKISKVAVDPLNINKLHVDLKIEKIEFKPQLTYYVNQDYCGMTDWVFNQYKEMTGLSCPAFLGGDSHHTSMRAVGDIDYSTIEIVSASKIKVIAGYRDRGDSDNERKVDVLDLVEVTKI